MARADKGKSQAYMTPGKVRQAMDGIEKSNGVHCGRTTDHTDPYTCHRGPKHEGCHLDVDRDTWFDKYKGRWILMPRQDDGSRGARGGYRGRTNVMTTRRGV